MQGGLGFKKPAAMIYGLYLSAQGAQNQTLRLQTIANNVANADTTGFKRDLAVFQDYLPYDVEHGYPNSPPGDLNKSTGGTSIATTHTDFTEGPLYQTDVPFDVAITGPGFLQVRRGPETFLTRNGGLTVNDLGELVTQDQGLPVLSTRGSSVIVPKGIKTVNIGTDGKITAANAEGENIALGQLNVVKPASLASLEKVGGSLYRSSGQLQPAGPGVQLRQGYLEASGVNPISETVQMIETSRAFETNINMIRFQDETLSHLLQSMAKR